VTEATDDPVDATSVPSPNPGSEPVPDAAASAGPSAWPGTSAALLDGVLAPVGTSNPLGARWNWFRYEADGFEPAVRALAGGSTWIELVWCDVAREPGALSWTVPDRAATEAGDLGYTLAFKLRTGSCALTIEPATDEDPLRASSSVPAETDSYIRFVREAVTRYSAWGVHLWAIENEIDATNAWTGTADEFVALARAVVPVVRQADPQAMIADPGVSSVVYGIAVAADRLGQGDEPGALEWLQTFSQRRVEGGGYRFGSAGTPDELRSLLSTPDARRSLDALDAIFALHAANLFDIYQLHWYDAWALVPAGLAWIREHIPEERPIEAWEAGVAWPGSGYDPSEHAHDTARLVAVLLGGGVERVVYLPVFQTAGSRLQPVEIWRGLYEPDARPRPAAAVFETLTRLTAGGDVVFAPLSVAVTEPGVGATPTLADGLLGVAIERPDSTAFIVWSDTGRELTLDLPDDWVHAGLDGEAAAAEITPVPTIVWAPEPGPSAMTELLSNLH
jgi:hypothetical protein